VTLLSVVCYSHLFTNFSFRTCPGSVASTLEANKYKLLMRIPLNDLEIMKGMSEYIICLVCVQLLLF
jgi:hypothetical protein